MYDPTWRLQGWAKLMNPAPAKRRKSRKSQYETDRDYGLALWEKTKTTATPGEKAMARRFCMDNTEGYDEDDLSALNEAWTQITSHDGSALDESDGTVKTTLDNWANELLCEYDAGKRGRDLTAWFYASNRANQRVRSDKKVLWVNVGGICRVRACRRAMRCDVCRDKRYLICERDDGRSAVERCDNCQAGIIMDEDAALLAQADGIECANDYPCYVTSEVPNAISRTLL